MSSETRRAQLLPEPLTVAILVGYLAITRRDIQPEADPAHARLAPGRTPETAPGRARSGY